MIMKKEKEVLAVYDEVKKGKKGWSVKITINGMIKHIGRFKSQKAANNKFESLTKKQ